jgi:hypothetical protein
VGINKDKAARTALLVSIVVASFRIGLGFTDGREQTPYEPIEQAEFRRVAAPSTAPHLSPRPTEAPAFAIEAAPSIAASPSPSPSPAPSPRPKPPTSSVSPYKPWREFPADVSEARAFAYNRLGKAQFRCLDILWDRESRWRTKAENKRSGAYGIPQALPGTKMASAGSDWRTNPMTQVKWGLRYVSGRYGTACRALDHSYRTGWY